ncbi:MAG: hypothetical protein AB7K71_19915 [Polyangiaceae bacterium]
MDKRARMRVTSAGWLPGNDERIALTAEFEETPHINVDLIDMGIVRSTRTECRYRVYAVMPFRETPNVSFAMQSVAPPCELPQKGEVLQWEKGGPRRLRG